MIPKPPESDAVHQLFQPAKDQRAPKFANDQRSPQSADNQQTPATGPPIMKEPQSTDTNSIHKWPKWSGDPADFPAFHICLEGAAEGHTDHKSFCYSVFSHSLPAEAQRRVAPWMRTQKAADDWNSERFISHLEELFVDRDAPTRAQVKINTIKQGPRQTFAKFRSVFEQLCSEADYLAPTGVSKVNAMKSALAPHLRKGIAYRQGVSETVYESFVREVQNLAKELESMPDGRPSRG
ncbi:hypothetical protein K3495_g3480, partial [Podosphaera aphanis]